MSNENSSAAPAFPASWQPLVDAAAHELRRLALNEEVKARVCSDPELGAFMHRVSKRYVAGRSVDDAVKRVSAINQRGHRASAEYMGESCRDEGKANAETEVFLALIEALDAPRLDCSISFDLSHIGSVVDPELGYRNATRVAGAAARAGREVMISMESAERADMIYATYARLCEAEHRNVGITVPAKLYRTDADLEKLMVLPGRIRLVKGAFLEAADVACARDSPELGERYRGFARRLITNGVKCSIATHDASIQQDLASLITERRADGSRYEFESLIGLGQEQIDALHAQGFPTREYAVFGEEHFLYVLNRIAEQPIRVYQAIIDLLEIQ